MKKINSKKIILIVAMVIQLIKVLLVILMVYTYSWFSVSMVPSLFNDEYYREESYETPKDETIYFRKYYYYEYSDDFFGENDGYELVEDNIETIKRNIENSLNYLNRIDDTIDVEFDYDVITSNDYFDLKYLSSKTMLYYYDIDNHILYITFF